MGNALPRPNKNTIALEDHCDICCTNLYMTFNVKGYKESKGMVAIAYHETNKKSTYFMICSKCFIEEFGHPEIIRVTESLLKKSIF